MDADGAGKNTYRHLPKERIEPYTPRQAWLGKEFPITGLYRPKRFVRCATVLERYVQ